MALLAAFWLTAGDVRGATPGEAVEWPTYRGNKLATQYSGLSQINRENVHRLRPAWEYRHGEPEGPGLHSNPVIVGGRLYFVTPRMQTVALDARTGRELWRFDPSANDPRHKTFRGRSRGVIFWQDERGGNGRIFSFVMDRVYAIDPATGQLIASFGEGGWIDLRNNASLPPEQVSIEAITPGITYKNFLMPCYRVPEGSNSTPGDVRAYDTLTGELKWSFHTIPHPGEVGYDTWQREKGVVYGGANPWGGFSVDEARGWVFFATGAGAPDLLYGGQRKGANLFANCVVALDATTGKRQWHYQTIHHDIWDYDCPPAPILATITVQGVRREVVVQMGKNALTFVLDRTTGVPVFPVEERPVPGSSVAGEEAWPTQPIPLLPPPLARQVIGESDLTNISPEARAFALSVFRVNRSGPMYTPITLQGNIIAPGLRGGVEWGGGGFDPATGIIYVNANERPSLGRLIPIRNVEEGESSPVSRGQFVYHTNCTTCHGLNRAGSPPVFPSLAQITKTREEVRGLLARGQGLMPAFSNLGKATVDDLVAFLFDSPAGEISAGAVSTKGPGAASPAYAQSWTSFVDSEGFPAISPPWGTLNAVDLNRGEILWKVPLGEYPRLVERGIRNTGAENFGGPVVTAGGLIFIAATPDEKIRAFDVTDGQVRWEHALPAGGYATPSIYMLGGRQYLVIAAGGGGKQGTRLGSSIMAFALPD